MFIGGRYPAERLAKSWNTRFSGKEAFNYVHTSGYKIGSIHGHPYRSQRVAFAIYYGRWPENEIDHIDGVRTDNCIKNLRDVWHATNTRNRKRPNTNTSGFMGVSWSKCDAMWCARIKVDGARIFLGNYNDIEEAAAARKAADVKYNFHSNHGRI